MQTIGKLLGEKSLFTESRLGSHKHLTWGSEAMEDWRGEMCPEHLLWWHDSVWKSSRNFWGESHSRDLEFNVWDKARI